MTSEGNAGVVARVLEAYRDRVAGVARAEGCSSVAQEFPAPPVLCGVR
jgi:hypothetical protein